MDPPTEKASKKQATLKKPPPFQRRLRRQKRRMAFNFKKGTDDGNSTEAKISITFVGSDPPEGVVRLNDQVLKTIP